MKKTKVFLKSILCGYIIFFMILYHGKIGSEITAALKLWYGVLIPSLFPYLVLAQYVTSSDVMNILYPLKKITHSIFNISESSSNVYLCSLLSGYPSGALCTTQLYNERIIEKDEAERLVCFTNNAGPLFVISVVGANMLGSSSDGLALYVIQCISAMIIGIGLGRKSEKTPYTPRLCKAKGMGLLVYSQNAINTMLQIGALLVLASVTAMIGIISFEMIPVYGNRLSAYAKVILYSFLEITSAVNFLSDFGNTKIVFCVISSVLSWSGLCVLMQIKSALPDGFSMSKILRCKLVQSVISFWLAFGYKSFFVSKLNFETDKAFTFSLIASVIIFVFFMFKKKAFV